MNRTHLALFPLLLLVPACSKPPPPSGPPSDFPVPCVVGVAKVERMEEKLPMVGTVRAIDSVRIQSELEARVLKVGFAEGQAVKAGDVLFELDDRRERARLDEALARLERARKDLERGAVLLASQTIPPQEEDRLREAARAAEANVALARAAVEDATLRAPFDGVMGEKAASQGQFVGRGGTLGSLTRMDPLEVAFDVPERFVSQIAPGQEIRLDANAYPGRAFTGKVKYLAPELQEESRTLRVKAELGNADGALRPGMFGVVTLVFSVKENALVIPEAAVLQQGEQAMVVTRDAEGRAGFRPVRTGLRQAGRVEIVDGLAAGEQVVVEGHQKTRPGAVIIVMPGSREHGVEPPPPAEAGPGAKPAPETKPQPSGGESK